MSVVAKLAVLALIKENIKVSLVAKGQNVTNSTPFTDYSQMVDNIETDPENEDITVTSNGTYTAGENYDGLGTVTVSVPQKADLLTDEVNRTVTTKSRGRVPAQLTGVTQTGGTMTDDFVYTCASNAYLLTDRAFPYNTADTWELYFKYKWAGKNQESIFGDDYKCPGIWIFNNKPELWLCFNGSSWGASTASNLTLTSGTTYFFKVGFDGYRYYLEYNLDGSDNYTRVLTLQTSSKLYTSNEPMRIANNNYGLTQRYCTGQLYLQDTKLYVDDDLYWQAVTPAGEWQDL